MKGRIVSTYLDGPRPGWNFAMTIEVTGDQDWNKLRELQALAFRPDAEVDIEIKERVGARTERN